MRLGLVHSIAIFLSVIHLTSSLSFPGGRIICSKEKVSRFLSTGVIGFGITLGGYTSSVNAMDALDAAMRNSAITYSNNAKNFKRMGEGDFTQGSRDISQSPAAQKRRAVKGCKTEGLRVKSGLTERECIDKTMHGDIQFMLDIYAAEVESD